MRFGSLSGDGSYLKEANSRREAGAQVICERQIKPEKAQLGGEGGLLVNLFVHAQSACFDRFKRVPNPNKKIAPEICRESRLDLETGSWATGGASAPPPGRRQTRAPRGSSCRPVARVGGYTARTSVALRLCNNGDQKETTHFLSEESLSKWAGAIDELGREGGNEGMFPFWRKHSSN